MLKNLWNNEAGFIISAELVLVLTIGVIGVITGLAHIQLALVQELNDVAGAIGSLDQSFSFVGFKCCDDKVGTGAGQTSFTRGAGFTDSGDHCDCGNNCDIIVQPTPHLAGGTAAG